MYFVAAYIDAAGFRWRTHLRVDTMTANDPPLLSQLVVRGCQFPAVAIAMAGGALQMALGQPDTNPRLDNVHARWRWRPNWCGLSRLVLPITLAGNSVTGAG